MEFGNMCNNNDNIMLRINVRRLLEVALILYIFILYRGLQNQSHTK